MSAPEFDLTPLTTFEVDSIEEEYDNPELELHRVISHVAFAPKPMENDGLSTPAVLLETSLREDTRYVDTNVLVNHPLIVRSYATDVPIDKLSLAHIAGHHISPKIGSKTGVTVYDILSAIHHEYVHAIMLRDIALG